MDSYYKDKVIHPIFAFSMGTFLEFLDFALYASLAPIFAIKFFPKEFHEVSIIYSWGIFAISFLVRPFAGILLGPMGDKLGIKRIMLFSLTLMGISTALIGILPTYEQGGIVAPLLLITLRIIQGFAVSVEYGGLSVYLSTLSKIKSKFGFYSSFTSLAVILGLLGGSLVTGLFLNEDSLLEVSDWRWRAPFILCGLSVGISGLYFRYNLKITQISEYEVGENPLRTLLKHQFTHLFLNILIVSLVSISSYIVIGYLATYLQYIRNYHIKDAVWICNLGGIAILFSVPLGGWLSDKIGRISLMIVFSFSMILVSILSILLIAYGSKVNIIFGLLLLALNVGMLAGGIPALITESFQSYHRYTGVTIAYNSAVAWFGGTAPMIISFLIIKTDNVMIPGLYMSFFALLSFLAAIKLKADNKRISNLNALLSM